METMETKEQVIKKLTDLMAVIQMAHFKKGFYFENLRVHESMAPAAISIDLYHFEGDGKPVCDGLSPCTITYDDGTEDHGDVYCMVYDPDDVTPLTFLFDSDAGELELDPEDVTKEVLENITAWLELAMQPMPEVKVDVPQKQPNRERNPVTDFFYYMWNKWSQKECDLVFADDFAPHFWTKWCQAYDRMGGPRGAAEVFYNELSSGNRDKLVRRAQECYSGMDEL